MQKKKSAIIVDIVLYIVSGLLILLTAAGIVIRATNNNNFYLFGHRFDVVLTDSMSSKNEAYLDFLEGHDDQIDPFDLVISKKVESEKELDVYDIVLFNDPSVGVNMHRIVGKNLLSTTRLSATKSQFHTVGEYEGICLLEYGSSIVSNDISFKEMSLVTYSKEIGENHTFLFTIKNELLEPVIVRETVSGGLLTTYTLSTDEPIDGVLVVNHGDRYDFNNEIIVSCVVTLSGEEDQMTLDKSQVVAIGDSLVSNSNYKYEYETRGDKAKVSDGYFKKDAIISKVEKRIPRLGYIVRYLTSIWGIIMFVSLGVLILVSDIILNKLRKKEAASIGSKEVKEGKEKKDEKE